ncbi:hypothetical protein PRK78_004146 [Emydomyces testavorans]|uniref:Polyketide synthase n=1 Tax=Emydomyces testavorans TaxID=2070801 RepID=A0AAF0IJ04_9EURO|nr:hypothetical protein PRK78_004146 [Emydomyces testavorans]
MSYFINHAANGLVDNDAVAIIGFAARFPQDADTNENLWKFLLRSRNAMTPFPNNRVNHQSHYHPDPEHGATYDQKRGDDDGPSTENINGKQTAGIPLSEAMSSMTSVFVSGFNHDFHQLLNYDPELLAKYKPTGMSNSILANRISWFYDFKAASLTVDTACSSSMVAFHLGCQDLKNKESEMAVISGVNLLLWPNDLAAMSHHGFLSHDGQCYSFDHRASGYARGEGVGTVILKRLSDALRDGNTIRAVVRGTGVNQDGRTPGITLPNGNAQVALIRDIYNKAGLEPEETPFIESHGTGTAAGDPIELRAIAQAFKASSRKAPLYVGAMKSGIGHLEGGAGIASVIKSVMILESGIIVPNTNFEKANPKIPMNKWNVHFPLKPIPWPSEGRRRISINSMGFGGTNSHAILDDAASYLSSLGLAGTHRTLVDVPSQNDIQRMRAHFDSIEETGSEEVFPATEHVNGNTGSISLANGALDASKANEKTGAINGYCLSQPLLFLLSAFDESGILRNSESLLAHLRALPLMSEAESAQYISDLAYTLCSKRSQFSWRNFCIASTLEELVSNLRAGFPKSIRSGRSSGLGFVFTGQGAQWYAMGRELLIYSVFRESLEAADDYIRSLGSTWSLFDELQRDQHDSKIHSPVVAHIACVALQIAVVELLASWNIFPKRVVGHSSGEVAAAYCAGKLGRRSAWKVAYFRGAVSAIQGPTKGAMLAVGLSEADLEPYIAQIHEKFHGELIIACYNSPTNNTISGDEAKVDALKALLDADSVFARKLAVQNAYHSNHMKAVADEYSVLLGDIKSTDKLECSHDVHMFSSVTGQLIDPQLVESAEYWFTNLISPVNFTKSLSSMCFQSISKDQKPVSMNGTAENVYINDIVEIGPHGALQSAIKQTIGARSISSIGYLPVLDRNNPGPRTILAVAGQLNSKGYNVNISEVNNMQSSIQQQLIVKLPPYSFDHSTKIWYESRITRNIRLREYPKHDLFGAPVVDWNAEEPRWRYVIRLSENPWLREHVVTGNYIYPGAGYVVMAIEAAKQHSDSNVVISGYRLQNVSINTALNVPDTKDGVEVMISMSRMDESSRERSKTWWNFRIMSFNPTGNDWIEHCTGYIAVEAAAKTNVIDNGLEAEKERLMWQKTLETASETCLYPLPIARIYENLDDLGLTFGPLFQNLSDVKLGRGSGKATGIITIPDVASSMPKRFLYPHVVHPCTIDSALHLFLASVLDSVGEDRLSTAMLPTFIREVWVSSGITSRVGHMFRGYGKSTLVASQKYETDIMIWDGEAAEGRISIKGLMASPLPNSGLADTQTDRFCHTMEWKPDLDLLRSDQILDVMSPPPAKCGDRRRELQDLQLATMLNIMDALDELKTVPIETYEGHFRKYYQWLLEQAQILQSDSMIHLPLNRWMKYKDDTEFKERFYPEVAKMSPEGALCIRMGSNIARVLKKEADPLYLMFGIDDLLEKVYTDIADAGNLSYLTREYIDIIGHNRTDLNILEIGAGTGSSTAAFLEVLSPLPSHEQASTKTSRIAAYTFTDISAAFFEKAKERFRAWRNILNFRTLNIQNCPQEQGFSLGEYDIIVAGNVLHATPNLRETLRHVRNLLKPGGKLVMYEGIRQDFLSTGLSFGQLEGWWLGVEDARKRGAWVSEEEWDKVLRDTGFSGVDVSLKDQPDADLHSISVLVASAIGGEDIKSRVPAETLIITAGQDQDYLSSHLVDELVQKYAVQNCSIVNYGDLSQRNLTNTLCISLVELSQSALADPTEDEFTNIRYLLATCEGALWVTGDFTSNPELNMIAGVIRTVRWERDLEKPNLITLSISDPRPSQAAILQVILDIFEHQFVKANESKENAEYLLKNGVISTNRLVDATEMNDYLTAKVSKPIAQMLSLGKAEAERPLRLTTGAPGMLNKLQFETDPVWYETLGDFDVEVKIQAVGLNFRDVMISMGEQNAMTFGGEGAGVVTRVGSSVKKVQVGDRVCFMDGVGKTGTFQTYGRAIEDLVTVIPNDMSIEIAASLPSVYATAIYGLYTIAGLAKGETVLIHSAAGGVGQAAITLANLVGAEVFATVSTCEKADLLVREYGVKRDHIFSSRDLLFVKGIMRMTNGKGVDVVLNSLSGEFLRRTWECIARFGRFVEIGKKDAQNDGRITLKPFLRNVVMASVELLTLMRYRPKQLGGLLERTIRLYTEGKIKAPSPTKILDYSHLEESFRALQSGKGMGKIVLVPKDDAVVPVVPRPPVPLRLNKDASYVLSGGLGGVGRSLALWMASIGAKNLIFLSRSGAASPAAQKTVQELHNRGVTARVFACDVSNKASLKAALKACEGGFPPIKGCIQGAMVLADKMFENMSHEEYLTATRPKVQGSWNLHDCLPKDMDFFVLLSSGTGLVGNRGQANYAAGNTYQDALAAHRVSLGLPATSLDLGILASIGYVAENRERLHNVQRLGSLLNSVREEEIHTMVEYHLNSKKSTKSPVQIASGLTTAGHYAARGMPLPSWMHSPLFTQLASTSSTVTSAVGSDDTDSGINLASQLGCASSISDAGAIIADAIRTKLSKLLSIPVENIDAAKSVSSNGIDSLVAMEFRMWLAKVVGADVPILEILGTMPIAGSAGLSMKVAMATKLVPEGLKTEEKKAKQ